MMKIFAISLTLAALPLLIADPADARDRRGEQSAAREGVETGKVQSLRSIENRVLPRMGDAEYLGPEYDPAAAVYRLKFIRGGRVIFVDVDARTGAILRQR